eukprot:scaffold624_cov402-Prasinococcus_capsulatus_cf.AAC.24
MGCLSGPTTRAAPYARGARVRRSVYGAGRGCRPCALPSLPFGCGSRLGSRTQGFQGTVRCVEVHASAAQEPSGASERPLKLEIGDAVVLIQEPPYLKTADTMPSLRDSSAVRVGEAGRVIGVRPKNVWAVLFQSGQFLVDDQYLDKIEE